MTLEEVVIAIARIAGSLPVLWWPLGGGILAVLVDFSDLFMMNLLDLGGVRDYQAFDKWVDQVYMVAFLVVALRWKGVPRYVAIGLFAYRIVGFAYFEFVNSWRGILLFFPNVFEFWFLFVAGLNRFKPDYEMTWKHAALWISAASCPEGVPGVRASLGQVARQVPRRRRGGRLVERGDGAFLGECGNDG